MLIDLHCHSKALSPCSIIDYKDLIDVSKTYGYDGFVLTNHYASYIFPDLDRTEYAKRYIQEYFDAKEYGDKVGFKVFFGIEVTLENEDWKHVLIYGVEPDFLLKHPRLYEYRLKDVYAAAKKENGIVVQAHPLRKHPSLLDVNYLDGVELNCTFNFDGPHFEDVVNIRKENNLLLTAGSDYHGDSDTRPVVGLVADVEDIYDIVSVLLSKNYTLKVQEKEGDNPFDYLVNF